jgi:hypothetical protein
MIGTSAIEYSKGKGMAMGFTEWFDHWEKPDFNGVYQCRFSAKPDDTKYHLYRNGWHAGCDTPEEAEKVVEKFYPPLDVEIRNGSKVLVVGRNAKKESAWQWRGLAEKPKGEYRFEASDKYR